MQRYFLDTEINKEVTITGDDFHHIKNVMRMREEHKVSICDFNGNCYLCSLKNYLDKSVIFEVLDKIEESNELSANIYLACGLLKGDKLEYVIQKATELGVSKIIPLSLKRNIVKLDSKKELKKITRWNKIAKEAAEQSKRNKIPEIKSVMTLQELTKIDADYKFVAYEETSHTQKLFSRLQNVTKSDIIILVVGPEGGLDIKEVEQLRAGDFTDVSLGKRILRAETACIHSVGVIAAYIDYLGC